MSPSDAENPERGIGTGIIRVVVCTCVEEDTCLRTLNVSLVLPSQFATNTRCRGSKEWSLSLERGLSLPLSPSRSLALSLSLSRGDFCSRTWQCGLLLWRGRGKHGNLQTEINPKPYTPPTHTLSRSLAHALGSLLPLFSGSACSSRSLTFTLT
jgi:hypothetical protein